MKRHFFFVVLTLLSPVLLFGQRQATKLSNDLPLSWSFAYSAKDERLPEGYGYSPLAFFMRYKFGRLKPFDTYVESQLARASEISGTGHDYEFGFNLGLAYRQAITPNLKLTASLGSGPYYVTVRTRRQARGFIFSDNLEVGLQYYWSKAHLGIQLRGRYRHISNAGLKSPNGGIDNFFLVVGVSKAL